MDTQNLNAFVRVAQQQSFSLAAEDLHITQPAVSKRIAMLEQQVGKTLFDRIGRNITLTEAGNILLPRAQRILQEVRDTQRQLSDMSGEVEGVLNIATSHHIGLHRLPNLLKQYKHQYPNVDLQLSFIDSEQAYDAITHGKTELAIITLPMEVPGNISAYSVWEDGLEFVASRHHPLSKIEKVRLPQLLQFPAILPEQSTFTTQIVQTLFEQHGLKLQIQMPTNFLETIKMMVSIELGWSVLPKTLVDEQLKPINLPSVSLSRRLGYVHHKERTLSNAAHAFISLLQNR